MDSSLHPAFDRPQISTSVLPSVNDLVDCALADTDFLGDLLDGDIGWLEHIAANSIDLAADLWSERRGITVPLPLIMAARRELCTQAQCLLTEMAEAEADRIRDAQDAGDIDSHGDPIPQPRYRSI